MKNLFIISIFTLFANPINAQTKIAMLKEEGVYTIPCKINGLPLKFIFDTGASDVSISLTEAVFMLKNGYLKKEDLGESVYYSIANGDVAKGTKLNIKEIEFSGLKLYNIQASILHETSAPLLLGQSAIEKLGKIQLEGNQLTILNGVNSYYDYTNKNNTTIASLYNNAPKNNYSLAAIEFNFKSLPVYSGIINTNETIPVFDKPDMLQANNLGNIVGTAISIIKKENDKYYLVKSGNLTGYVFVGYIMKSKK
ncbi:TIGR02281 family clan AA aspartic protease [Flavobacterium sp.]|uniref:retropepsin-like aspartic protease family protein n=1 Tax=Flavobacterium sp. TaxID=239 RepID=UPI0035ADFA44